MTLPTLLTRAWTVKIVITKQYWPVISILIWIPTRTRLIEEIYYMTLRNNVAQYTTRARTSIDAVFSAGGHVSCMIVFSAITCLYTFKSPGRKQDFLRPPEDDEPRKDCGSMEFCLTN
ncbi:hypothetical protein CDAR_186081 [Caerostris darwini]|uniref:Uncharacterized protein n=1 Tax=Caerostris darwini TaxID=1538125 RepID=A0AAV4WAW0_9ARAC|nr:hypothetical protein CDAR_186081 [Caerostris darwini]